MKKPTIPTGYKHLPGVKFYSHYDEESGRSYVAEVLEDGSEVFSQWLLPEFSRCIEDRIKDGKFGDVKTYRL